jgi:hypothetical protein
MFVIVNNKIFWNTEKNIESYIPLYCIFVTRSIRKTFLQKLCFFLQNAFTYASERRMSTAPNLHGLDSSSTTTSPPITRPQTEDEQTDDEVQRRTPKGKVDDTEEDANDEVNSSGPEDRPKVVFEI